MNATELKGPEDLVAWQKRCGLRRDIDAAAALGIAASTYRAKRKGRSPIDRQDELLAAYYEIHSIRWLSIAEAAMRLARISDRPDVAFAPAVRARQLIDEVIGNSDNSR